jgi:hypothetical protein
LVIDGRALRSEIKLSGKSGIGVEEMIEISGVPFVGSPVVNAFVILVVGVAQQVPKIIHYIVVYIVKRYNSNIVKRI